jgi:FkbM family methyltransferase
MHPLVAAFSKVLQHRPFTYVDCGARGGHAPRWPFKASSNARFIGIEPDADECARLNRNARPGHQYLPVCVGRVREERAFYITKNPSCSSLLKPNYTLLRDFDSFEHAFEVVRETRVTTVPLDACLSEHGIPGANFLELDTQGSELDILQGAESQLRDSVVGVQAEVEFAPMYESQPLFADVDAYLRPRGFQLFDLSRYRVRRTSLPTASPLRGQLLWGHATYLRDHKLIESREMREDLAFVAASLGFLDYAAEIVDALLAMDQAAASADDWQAVREQLSVESRGSYFSKD